MSLYYEAENTGSAGVTEKAGHNRKFRMHLLTCACCFLVFGGASFYVVSHSDSAGIEKIAAVEKVRLLREFSLKTAELTNKNSQGKGGFPFVGESRVHEYRIKFLSPVVERTNKNKVLEETVIYPEDRIDTMNANKAKAVVETNATGRKLSVEELFNQAVDETGGNIKRQEPVKPEIAHTSERSLWDLPKSSRQKIPSFVYSAHNYSTDPYKRTVVINGKTLREGGEIGRLSVRKINPTSSIFAIDGIEFTQRSLEDYEAHK